MEASPAKTVLVREGLFEETPAGPALIGSRCAACGQHAFPGRAICYRCQSTDQERVHLGRQGRLVTYAVSWVAPTGFEPPLIQGFVDLPEGVRLFSMIEGIEPRDDALSPGDPLELTIAPLRVDEQGRAVLGYKFRPVKGGA